MWRTGKAEEENQETVGENTMSEYKPCTIEELLQRERLFELRDVITSDYLFQDEYTPSWGDLRIYQGNNPDYIIVLRCFALDENRVQRWKKMKQLLRVKGRVHWQNDSLEFEAHTVREEEHLSLDGALSLAPLDGGELSLAPEAGQLSLADVVKEER